MNGIDRRGLLAAGAGGLLVLAAPGTASAATGRTTRASTRAGAPGRGSGWVPNGHPCNGFGLAYSSTWWLQP